VKQLQHSIETIIKTFSSYKPFTYSLDHINSNKEALSANGLSTPSSLSLYVATLLKNITRPLLILFEDIEQAEVFRDDLEIFLSTDRIAFFPPPSHSEDKITGRTNTHLLDTALSKIISGFHCTAITSYEGLNLKVPAPTHFRNNIIPLKTGSIYDRDDLIEKLRFFDFNREYSVEYPREYSVRGDIVDVFSAGQQHPVRIEFYDNQIQSIRFFDIETQRTIKIVDSVHVYPPSTLSGDSAPDLLSYFPENTVILFPGYDTHYDLIKETINTHPVISSKKIICLNDLKFSDITFKIQPPPPSLKDLTSIEKHIISLNSNILNPYVFLFCVSSGQQKRLSLRFQNSNLTLLNTPLSNSFEIPDINLFIYSELEILNKKRGPKPFHFLPRDVRHTHFNPNEIDINDFLVHMDYGIGKYLGLKKISAFGSERECLVIEYRGGDRVFVPLEKMNVVHKYRSSVDFAPRINKLGSGEWERVKLRTRRSIEDVSKEIIALYSARLFSSGFAFSKDNDLQIDMESEFKFEETPDQIKAINDIKRDMESSHPMDRLLCGDVGFGKTEVAIRAAFKAVNDSKQVAILAPTTILADQHFISFTDRLNKYPVKIALLSRFVKPSEQKRVIAGIANKTIDIVIGTHRLLSKDINFSDLGLLIIDEEHRFGVKDKDKIKKFRSNIDVLSLSATPIPRSLHFSLIGARDFSIINTPPKERLPIFTEIISFDKNIISKAIYREISRGGQVFFVHNEIKTIASVTSMLENMFPELTIRYVHGQMSESILEPIMLDFIKNRIHILVTTAIIESGIDISNANTIFINNAKNFGLSQLYQLRGRVGRQNRKAYAYLIVSKPTRLSRQAIKRLQTIQRHTSLGSGYSIALEDLEIRGSGNVFGLEQSGNLHAIGYDLFLKILQNSINKIKNPTTQEQTPPPTEEPIITFPFPAFFPESYISSESLRLHYYKRLNVVKTIKDLHQVRSEVIDIFGRLPLEGEYLFDMTTIKYYCIRTGVEKIIFDKNHCGLFFNNNHPFKNTFVLLTTLKETAASVNLSYKFIPSKELHFILFYSKDNPITSIKQFLYLLEAELNL
jgi:transcription-repair coupling factor (superfamily II helicase)